MWQDKANWAANSGPNYYESRGLVQVYFVREPYEEGTADVTINTSTLRTIPTLLYV